jgi:hypothetical protein
MKAAGAALVPAPFVSKLVASFERHATEYDGHYAEGLAAGLAKEAGQEGYCGVA